jgi:cysteine-rich repeat protein
VSRLLTIGCLSGAIACNAVSGVDDLRFVGAGATGGAASSGGSAPGSGGAGHATATSAGGSGSGSGGGASTSSSVGASGPGGAGGNGPSVCGNGTLEPGESCDDGGTVGGDGCSADCVAECTGNDVFEDPVSKHCYRKLGTMKTWADSEADCVAWWGHLAALSSSEEVALIEAAAEGWVWVGGTDQAIEGQFEWTNGEPFSFEPWGSSAPNLIPGNADDCTYFRGEGELLDDVNCSDDHSGLCERAP